jgi:hypothetical protein
MYSQASVMPVNAGDSAAHVIKKSEKLHSGSMSHTRSPTVATARKCCPLRMGETTLPIWSLSGV